jgi:hypothetical protein
VARAFFERWICRFSVPGRIVTDQGKEFCSNLMKELCKLWGVTKDRTSGFHPETNSSAESYNRTIIKYMRCVLDNNTTLEWEELLPIMGLSYNSHVHRSTKESPFFLTYHHDPRLPYFDLEKPRPDYTGSYQAETFRNMYLSFSMAKRNMEEAQTAREIYFDKKTKERSFQTGDRVLVYFPNVPVGINQKFYKRWQLFSVTKVVGPVNLEVRQSPTSRKVIVHVNRVRHADTVDLERENDTSGNPYEGQRLDERSRAELDVSDPEIEEEGEEYGPIEYFSPDRAERADNRQSRRESDGSFHSLDQEEEVQPDPTPEPEPEQEREGAAGGEPDPWSRLANYVFPGRTTRSAAKESGQEWESSEWWIPKVPLEYQRKKK